MIRKSVYISLCFLLAPVVLFSQTHYIGLHSDEIKLLMREEQKTMNLDNSTVNKTFKYLKYVDYLNEQTLLFFLDDNDCCNWWKLMCDYSLLTDKKEWLNSNYRRLTTDTWRYTHKGEKFVLKLIEDEWFFTIAAKPEENINN